MNITVGGRLQNHHLWTTLHYERAILGNYWRCLLIWAHCKLKWRIFYGRLTTCCYWSCAYVIPIVIYVFNRSLFSSIWVNGQLVGILISCFREHFTVEICDESFVFYSYLLLRVSTKSRPGVLVILSQAPRACHIQKFSVDSYVSYKNKTMSSVNLPFFFDDILFSSNWSILISNSSHRFPFLASHFFFRTLSRR